MEQKALELAVNLKALKDKKKIAEQEVKDLNAEIAQVETKLIDWMVEAETPSFKHKGSGFTLVLQSYPNAEPERKDELYEQLKQRGYEHLFTINHQTLSSALKEMIMQNEEVLPDWLEGLVKNYEKASIRIYKG